MSENLTRRIIKAHLVEGEMTAGSEIAIKIDQTLTQDATGTMAYLEFESIGIPKVKTELSVSYLDHNCMQIGYRNADDHRFLQSIAKKYGIQYSSPGNGICHQVHMERYGVPGKTLLGSDSHTPHGGSLGMLAIGAGGLDVAMAMAGQPFYVKMPKVVNVELVGKMKPYVASKDIILELLRRLSVKGGVGKVFEYSGEGVKTLSVPQRATICNMGAELGATSSVFPSDEQTLSFLKAQKREECYKELSTGADCEYDEHILIDLSTLEPMVAQPHMPDRVVAVKELEGMKVNQVWIGSCTNSNYRDLVSAAKILKGKTVHPDVNFSVTCASKQVMHMLAEEGYLNDLLDSGARILESICGPCAGGNQAPCSKGISVRTNNRNFEGRSGTKDGQIYLVSPETAAMTALKGYLTDASEASEELLTVSEPAEYYVDDRRIFAPEEDGSDVEIIKGPNIKALPEFTPLEDTIKAEVMIKVEDNISTDHIIPALPEVAVLRSNIPAISQYVFSGIDPSFAKRCEGKSGIIVGGKNYGQGSSREHAALAPKYLGIKVVLAQSFARIHGQNLVNFGILPLYFSNPEDYEKVEQGDELVIENLIENLRANKIVVTNLTKGQTYKAAHELSDRQIETIIAGGLLRKAAIDNCD